MLDGEFTSVEKFIILRCLVAMAHADGVVTDDEISYINNFAEQISLSPLQKAQLSTDFDVAQDPFILFSQLENPAARSQVLYFARILAHQDGVLDPSEEELLRHLNMASSGQENFEPIKELARQVAADHLPINEGEAVRNSRSRPRAADFSLLERMLMEKTGGGAR